MRDHDHRAPPWWPQGEEWRGGGPPWRRVSRRFRRRFLLVTVGVLAVLVAIGFAFGRYAHGGPSGGHGAGSNGDWGWGAGWWPVSLVWFVLVVGGLATARAYRRIGGPVADLLGAADRVSRGEYDVDLRPSGPRELQALTRTFNDLAARLAATEEQRRRFLADVTHELRTPLAVLQSGIEAQVDGIHPRDDRHLASLLEETQILGRLIDDLHTLALADAGRLTLHLEATSAGALVDDAVVSHAALAERRGIALVTEVAADAGELDADPTRLRQVLANLLSNAVRHTPDGGWVRIDAGAAGDGVAFTVTDSGPGIPADQLAVLFDRTVGSADSHRSGLGLSIARDLVTAHGGAIQAGNAPAGGASVRFTVPRHRPARP